MDWLADLAPEEAAKRLVWRVDSALGDHLERTSCLRAVFGMAVWAEDPSSGVSEPIASTDEVKSQNPINDLIFRTLAAEIMAVGLSMPIRPVAASGLDEEASALVNRQHLIVLRDDRFSCQLLRTAEGRGEQESLAPNPYSDLLRRMLSIPTSPPEAGVAVGLAYDWLLRCVKARKQHRKLNWSDLVACLPASTLTRRATPDAIVGELESRAVTASWTDVLRSVVRTDARFVWFDEGSLARSPLLGSTHRELLGITGSECHDDLAAVLIALSPIFGDAGGGQALSN